MAQFRPILNENGVTEQQWRVLRALPCAGRSNLVSCARCSISSPSIVGVMLRLEEAGLVSRERMEDDQRRVVVTLKPKSRRIVQRLVPLIEERYAVVESALGTQSMQEVYDALDALLSRSAESRSDFSGPSRREPRRAGGRQRRCSGRITGSAALACRPGASAGAAVLTGSHQGRPAAHHFISPLLTFAPMSRATPRPAAGYAVLIALISSPELEALPSSVSNRLRYAWV